MNICMVGYGMMGVCHTEALCTIDCTLHTVVGRRPAPTQAFAERYGYAHWTTDLAQALAQPAIDIVILANPSAYHQETALASLAAGKHTLVEIPLAMSLDDAAQVVCAAKVRDLNLGVVHPQRMCPELIALRQRARAGQETIRHIGGRFFTRRLENVGGTGYVRSWTDNLLWHHLAHVCDFGIWLLDDPAIRQVYSVMAPLDPQTGSQMDVSILAETERDQTLVCTGSYYSGETISDLFVVSNTTSYRWDIEHSLFSVGKATSAIAHEMEYNGRIACDFVESVRQRRAPVVSGASVLPAMRLLQRVQDDWDTRHGPRSIPGRSLPAAPSDP